MIRAPDCERDEKFGVLIVKTVNEGCVKRGRGLEVAAVGFGSE